MAKSEINVDDVRRKNRHEQWDTMRRQMEEQDALDQQTRAREAQQAAQREHMTTMSKPTDAAPNIVAQDTMQVRSRGNWMKAIRSVPKPVQTPQARDLRKDEPSKRALAETAKANGGQTTRLQVIDAKLIDFNLRGDRSQALAARELISERTPLAAKASPLYRQWSAVIADQARALASG